MIFSYRQPKVLYAINTCKAFTDITLPRLMASMERAGVDTSDIRIFDSGSAWDFTALIEAGPHMPEYDFLFNLPDTCEVGPDFKWKVDVAACEADEFGFSVVGLKYDYAMCNIGLYRGWFLDEAQSKLAHLKGCSKSDAIRTEISGITARMACRYGWIPDKIDEFKVQEDPYGTGRPRWRRYFGAFDITKWTIYRSLDEVCEERARMV